VTRNKGRLSFLIAEAVLIVVSILLAFAIDAAWSERREARQRLDLLQALHSDFAATSSTLDAAIKYGAGVVARTGGYLEAARGTNGISRDSLTYLFSGVDDVAFFEPTVASYRTALSTGSIDLVRSGPLVAALTEFDFAEGLYRLHLEVSADLFYIGPLQDLRRAGVVLDSPSLRAARLSISVPPDFDLLGNLAVSSAEPLYTVQVNMQQNLEDMRAAAARITGVLDSLLAL
jgi:hypothetical protein